MVTLPPPVPRDPGALHELRRYLAAVHYDEHGVATALGHPDYDSLLGSGRAAVADARASDPLSVLVRLFAADASVPDADLRNALPEGLPDRLATCGLLLATGDGWRSPARVMPLDGVVVAGDLVHPDAGGTPADHVMTVSMSTKDVADVVVRRPVRRTLDVGTGCGVLAILAARHSETVVATDVNPRALAFAAFNLALNEVDNVELRLGDGYDPVAGERFDLLISNPPFVVAPRPRYAFRDSGLPGDAFVRRLVIGAVEHLAPGGLLQLLGAWVDRQGADSAERLRGWVLGSGCGTCVVPTGRHTARRYAELWSHQDAATPADRDALAQEWEQWLLAAEVQSVSEGYLFLRRGGVEWFRLDAAPETRRPPAGESVLRMLDAGDLLARPGGPRQLLELALRPAPGATLEAVAVAGGWHGGVLRLSSGFAYSARMEASLLSLVMRSDGRRRLRDLLADAVGEAGVDAVADAVCGAVASLVERGVLLPVEVSGR